MKKTLFLLLAVATQAYAQDAARLIRTPTVQGDTIVFSHGGDLWSMKAGDDQATRLTSDAGEELRPKISPDGKWIAFDAWYEGMKDVYLMPIHGGQPKRLTYDGGILNTIGWTPDGRVAYASIAGNARPQQRRLWFVSPQGDLPTWTPLAECTDLSYLPDGHTIAYTRNNSAEFFWRHYRGGRQGRVCLYDFATNHYSELPAGREMNYSPMAVGRSIYYISDKHLATQNLYRYDLDSKRDTQLTRYTDYDIRTPSTDGKSIVWERDGYLWLYDIKTARVEREQPKCDLEPWKPEAKSLGDQINDLSWSPDDRLAVEARGEIFSLSASGESQNLTDSQGIREEKPHWSPDGSKLAYISDATGEREVYVKSGDSQKRLTNAGGKLAFIDLDWSPDGNWLEVRTLQNDIYVLNATNAEMLHVVRAPDMLGQSDWSPDSRWLAFVMTKASHFGAIWAYDLANRKLIQLTSGFYSDSKVAFDQNGQYLYFRSSRSFKPRAGDIEPNLMVENTNRLYVASLTSLDTHGGTTIDPVGFESGVTPLPMPAGDYRTIKGTKDGLVYVTGQDDKIKVCMFHLGKQEPETLYTGSDGTLAFNDASTKLAIYQGGKLSTINLEPKAKPVEIDLKSITATIDPVKERQQIFWDAWRHIRDTFYDPNMRDLDWPAIGRHYAEYLPSVASREELNYVIGLMQAELGTSHMVVFGGDTGPNTEPKPVGRLGAEYEAVGDHVRFKHIYYGEPSDESTRGPLSEPGSRVQEGEYLLEIDGEPVTPRRHPALLLVGKANKEVTLTVNSTPALQGARKIRVKTVDDEESLRYADWLRRTREYVDKATGGRVGYMHIPNELNQGLTQFIRGFYSQVDKQAMIVDARWNPGGNWLQPLMVETLARTTQLGLQFRNQQDTLEYFVSEGPKAMLINEYSGSGGDSLPWTFKQAGLGPLIGTRTGGALVGQNSERRFVDGGVVVTPEVGIYDRRTGTLALENVGNEPDVRVDMRPDLVAEGKDPQLDAAIKYLIDRLARAKPTRPRQGIPRLPRSGLQ